MFLSLSLQSEHIFLCFWFGQHVEQPSSSLKHPVAGKSPALEFFWYAIKLAWCSMKNGGDAKPLPRISIEFFSMKGAKSFNTQSARPVPFARPPPHTNEVWQRLYVLQSGSSALVSKPTWTLQLSALLQ